MKNEPPRCIIEVVLVFLEALYMPFLAAAFLPGAVIADLGFGVQLAGEEGLDVVHRRIGDVVQSFPGQISLMGGYDHIGHGD